MQWMLYTGGIHIPTVDDCCQAKQRNACLVGAWGLIWRTEGHGKSRKQVEVSPILDEKPEDKYATEESGRRLSRISKFSESILWTVCDVGRALYPQIGMLQMDPTFRSFKFLESVKVYLIAEIGIRSQKEPQKRGNQEKNFGRNSKLRTPPGSNEKSLIWCHRKIVNLVPSSSSSIAVNESEIKAAQCKRRRKFP